MINEENLNKLYNDLIEDDKELTTKELNSYGFNSKDLGKLINDGVLERVKRGYYSFLDVDSLFSYGKNLMTLKEYDKATLCFEKCYQLNPNHLDTCFQLFLRAIKSKDYSKAFTYFETIYNNNEVSNSDGNFYLYLLSMITEIPNHHKEFARYLKLEDIKVKSNNKSYQDPSSQSVVRTFAIDQKFILAYRQLNRLIKERGRITVQDVIVRILLDQAIEAQNKLKKNIINLAIEKKYDEIISCLEEQEKQHKLTLADEYILLLAKEISNLKQTGIIPKKEKTPDGKLFEAINGKNFELALSLSTNYMKKNNLNTNDNAMFILLKDITDLIKTISNKTKEISPISNDKTITSKKNSKSNTSDVNSSTVINYLIQQDIDNALITLKEYLTSINKSQYEFLIVDLIKISLMEKDLSFSKPMTVLTCISNETFTFDISEYIKKFYETLAQNKFAETRIYLDIIIKANKLGQSCVFADDLEQILNITEKKLNNIKNNENLNKDDNLVEKEQNDFDYSDEVRKIKSLDCNTQKFIVEKIDEAREKGIVILAVEDNDRIEDIHNIIRYVSDIVSFDIGSGKNRRIVLRFRPYIKETLDYSKIAKEGKHAYSLKNYNLCIEKIRQLLQFGTPKAWVYAKLGLAYMKNNNKDMAIDYLTVANELSKEEHSDFEFTELIGSLKGMIEIESQKPKVKMSINEFTSDINNYYGIENIPELLNLINSGMSINEASIKLGLTDEQKAIATLIIAREYYSQEIYTVGDKYLKKVEKMENKTKFVISLLEEIKINKKFYKNRKSKIKTK